MCQIALFLVIMTFYVMFEKKTDRIVNIDIEKYEINCLHANLCYAFIRKEIFRKIDTNLLYTHNYSNMFKK